MWETLNFNDIIAIEMGFNNSSDFNDHVLNVDISTDEKLKAFKTWQIKDGTKEGILKLPKSD